MATSRLRDGAVAWTGSDGALHKLSLGGAGASCKAEVTWIAGATLLAEDVVVECQDGAQHLVMHVGSLGDPRAWTPGARTPVVSGFTPFIDTDCAATSCPKCEATLVADVNVIVEEASGGAAADGSKLVTPDYRRVFRIEVGAARSLANVHGTCASDAKAATLSVRFEQSAADFAYGVETPCMCE